MEMIRGNRAIHDHQSVGYKLHLFEKTDQSGYYKYLGEFRYAGHQIKRGPDIHEKDRRRIVFILELVPEPTAP